MSAGLEIEPVAASKMTHPLPLPAVPRDALAAAGFDPAESAGLFVGVSLFVDSGFTPVPFAVDDAIDLAHLFSLELQLLEPSKIVLALAGAPRKPATADRLAALVDRGARQVEAKQTDIYSLLRDQGKRSSRRGLFIASIATHGFSDQGGDFLVASDSLRHRIERTGVAVDELFDDVSRVSSPRRLVLLDACRERLTAETRALGEMVSAMSQGFAQAIATAQGQVVLAGATLGGYAYDDPALGNGVFSAAVIDGLRGAAGVDSRGFVTVRTLADYVDTRVVEWVQEHVPDHANLSRGIARRIEGAVETLPLAVDPQRQAARDAYRQRREAALSKLGENLGGTITGAVYDEVSGLLPEVEPDTGTEELLDEIEALDGTVRLRRSLVFYLESKRGEQGSTSEPRIDPGSVEPVADGGSRPRRGTLRLFFGSLALATAVALLSWLWPSGDPDREVVDSAVNSGAEALGANPEGGDSGDPSSEGVPANGAEVDPAASTVEQPFDPPPPTPPRENRASAPTSSDLGSETGLTSKDEDSPAETALQGSRQPATTDPTGRTRPIVPDFPSHCQEAQRKTGIEFVFVPGGTFTMGSEELYPELPESWIAAARPVHRVTLSSFWIGKYPVTNEQYGRFLTASEHREPQYWTDERFDDPLQPVVGVSWLDATEFTEWAGVLLPSEVQWEAAARGPEGLKYPWGDAIPTAELADFGKDSGPDRVGSHPKGAGPFEAEDQAGGVWEWCLDAWDADAYADRDGKRDPLTIAPEDAGNSSTNRVLRGGSWVDEAGDLPSAIRDGDRADYRDQVVGFRVVCGSAPEP